MGELALSVENQQKIATALQDMVKTGVIPVARFIDVYDRERSIERQTPAFRTLEQMVANRSEAIPLALRRAVEDGFFVPLWSSLLEVAAHSLSNADASITAIADEIGAPESVGVMQRVLRSAGLRSVSTLPAILRTARATALVTAKVPGTNKTTFGTGFLVSPTLMLTAAHVVEPLIANMKEIPGSAETATVQFFNQLEQTKGQWPVKARFASKWLVCMSPPNGSNGKLALSDSSEAAQRLDFALIRLSEPVGDVEAVDVTEPPDPELNGRLTVMGYGGGTECLFDDHIVKQLDAAGCRILHDVNTVEGISGGPCIDSSGRAVGLHEGSLTAVEPAYNRAIHLRAVRQWMKKGGSDPLTPRSEPPRGIYDRETRRAWVAAGETLLGKTEVDRQQWLDSVAHLSPDDPRGGASTDVFHPVFGRSDFHDWITAATDIDGPRRIALYSGQPGSGKSFSAAILRQRLKDSGDRVVVIPPAAAKKPLPEVMDFLTSEAGGQNVNGSDVLLRPTEGVIRRDLLPDTFSQLLGVVRGGSRPSALLWLIVDLGDDSALTSESLSNWKKFLIEAEKRTWVRLLIVGLSTANRGDFRASAAKPDQVESRSISPITSDEFLESISAQARAQHLDAAQWAQESSVLWDEMVEPLSPREGRSVIAVRAALEIRTMMRKAAEDSDE
ncbi:MAG TPA: trypsin-like peptidase domain-containing protein [Bryobacteraceae bacterium]|nr:trypsin-like peptidase domain-containing protein [Bryobacteraceae bacterium]